MMVIFPLEVAGASLSNWGNEGVVCIATDVSTLKWEPEKWSGGAHSLGCWDRFGVKAR